ncbi:helix-turn-helix domain-containing protein [Aggregatilineales bacterium SYSU G02658]
MPNPLQINLSEAQKEELEQARDHSPKAYVRERAAAILKIAGGMSASAVARHGLLRPRQYQTVCQWVKRYQASGIAALRVRQGRGRKAAFSPSVCDTAAGSAHSPYAGSSCPIALGASVKSLDAAKYFGK